LKPQTSTIKKIYNKYNFNKFNLYLYNYDNGSYRILYIKEGIDYLPIGCLTENSFSEDVEMLDTTTRENSGWRTSQPILQSFNIDFSGLQINTRFTNADLTKISYDKLKVLKRNKTLIEWKIENTDLVFLEYGKGYITSLSETNAIDEFITFSGTLSGSGAITAVDPTV